MSLKYSAAISEEILGDNAPVLFQGGLDKGMADAAKMGFDCVEIHIRNPDHFKAEDLIEKTVKHKIGICAIGTGLEYSLNHLSLTADHEDVKDEMTKRLKGHIDLAAALDAVVFLGLCRGSAPDYNSREAYLSRLEKALIPIAAYGLKNNVDLAFEPIAFYLTNLINTTEEALAFLRRPGLESIRLLLDTHHMYIEDYDLADSFKMCRNKIAHIHISDSNRKYPGSGNVNYATVGETIKDIGYDKAVSLEVLPYPTGEKAALEGLKAMRSNLGARM